MNFTEEQALNVATAQLMRAAVRALLWTHPEPEKLKAAWNYYTASAWRDLALTCDGEIPPIVRSTMQDVQTAMATYLAEPDSDGKVPPP